MHNKLSVHPGKIHLSRGNVAALKGMHFNRLFKLMKLYQLGFELVHGNCQLYNCSWFLMTSICYYLEQNSLQSGCAHVYRGGKKEKSMVTQNLIINPCCTWLLQFFGKVYIVDKHLHNKMDQGF
jgi:hypothetical protein